MKKLSLIVLLCAGVSACTQTEYVEVAKECPSCNPPVRHFEVVTECSDYQDTPLSGNTYAQCRYCTNKIYSNGVDVTAQFMGKKSAQKPAKTPCKR